MAEPVLRRMTIEEFLDWEGAPETRYELHWGLPVAMAPGRQGHQALPFEVGARIRPGLKAGCRVIPEGGLVSPIYADSFFIPDLLVTCTPIESAQRCFTDPILIAEILSPTTEQTDRQVKHPAYRAMPSVREILFVDAQRIYAEVHRRLDETRWLTMLHNRPTDVLTLESAGLSTSLAAFYDGLDIPPIDLSQASAAWGQPKER